MKLPRPSFKKLVFRFSAVLCALLTVCMGILLVSSISLLPLLNALDIKPTLLGHDISIESLRLDYSGGFRIRASGLALVLGSNATPVTVGEVETTIGFLSIIRRTFFPHDLQVRGVSIAIERNADGIYVGTKQLLAASVPPSTTGQNTRPEDAIGIVEFLNTIHSTEPETSYLATLRHVSLANAQLTLLDRVANTNWTTNGVDITLDHAAHDRIESSLSTILTRDGQNVNLSLHVSHDPGASEVPIAIGVKLPTSRVLDGYVNAQISELFQGQIEFAVSGMLLAHNAIGPASFRVTGKNNVFHLPAVYSHDLTLRSMQLEGTYSSAGQGTIELKTFAIVDERALELRGKAKVEDLSGRLLAQISLNGGNGSIENVRQYIPDGIIPEVSTWVNTNLSKAKLSDIALSVQGSLKEFPFDSVQSKNRFDVSCSFQDLQVTYVKDLPPGRNLSGTFRLNNAVLRVQGVRGTVGAQQAKQVEVIISNLYSQSLLSLKGTIAGEAKEAVALLKKVLPKVEMVAVQSGRHESSLKLLLPLFEDKANAGPTIEVESDLRGIAGTYKDSPQRIEGLDAHVSASQTKYQVAGKGKVDGETLDFSAEDAVPWQAANLKGAIKGVVPATILRLLQSQNGLALSGAPRLALSFGPAVASAIELSVSTDLRDVAAEIPQLAWRKNVGDPAKADAQGTWSPKSEELTFTKLSVSGPNIAVQGKIQFSLLHSQLLTLSLVPLRLGQSDFEVQYANKRWDIRGKRLVLSAASDSATVSQPSLPDELQVDISLNEFVFGNQRLANAKGTLERRKNIFEKLTANFTTGSDAVTRIALVKVQGKPTISIDSADAGGLLQILGMGGPIKGGTLSGSISSTVPAVFDSANVEGKIVLQDAEISNSKLLFKLLSFLSLQNLLSLQGQVPFSTIELNFRRNSPILAITEAKASGSVIAVYFNGTIDEQKRTIRGQGEAVQFQAISNLTEIIPLVGTFVSSAQKNLAAARYDVTGTLDDPQVSFGVLEFIPDIFKKPFWNRPRKR